MVDFPENVVEMVNQRLGGLDKLLGLRFVKATQAEFVAELDIGQQHLQPYGLVHGGVYTAMIETLCSVGAAVTVFAEGKTTVGLENATSFLRAVRTGSLRGVASPLYQGRRSHVWQAGIYDERKRHVADGRVRLLVLEPGSLADGKMVDFE